MSVFQRLLIVLAILMAVGALAISLTTLLHESMIEYNVTSVTPPAQAHYEYYTRSRGLIWTCVKDVNSAVLTNKKSEVKFGRCFEEHLQAVNGSAEMYLLYLRRANIGIKSAGILVNVLGLLLGFGVLMLWCMRRKSNGAKYRHYRGHVIAFWVFSVMLSLAAMAIFHLALDTEKYLALPKLPRLYVNWPATLKTNTAISWGIMYYLEWGAICLLTFAALILRCSVFCFPEKEGNGKPAMHDDRTYLYHNNPMMQLSAESLPPYDAYKTGPTGTHRTHTDDAQSARSAQSTRLPRYGGDSTYDNQAKNVYRIY